MSRVESIKELRERCQKTKERPDPAWALARLRKVSIYLTKLLLYTPVTANQVTLLMTLVGIGSGILFLFGDYWYSIAGALLLPLTYLLDLVDGEIARYRATASAKGTYYDGLSHAIVLPVVLVCISFGTYHISHNILMFVFGYLAALSFLLIEIENFLKSTHLESNNSKGIVPKGTTRSSISNLMIKLIGIKERIFGIVSPVMPAILFGAIFDVLDIMLIVFGITFSCFYVLQIIIRSISYRERV